MQEQSPSRQEMLETLRRENARLGSELQQLDSSYPPPPSYEYSINYNQAYGVNPAQSVPGGGINPRDARVIAPLAAIATAVASIALNDSGDEVKDLVGGATGSYSDVTAAEALATSFYFPTAISPDVAEKSIAKVLMRRGFTKDNTLFGHSTCPDEINHDPSEIVDKMKSRWGEAFALGGLAGVPFVGKAGFGAYSHHVPDGGKLLVLFAPHIGVGATGSMGKVARLGIAKESSACGAVVGSYKGLLAQKEEAAKVAAAAAAATTTAAAASSTAELKDELMRYFDQQLEYLMARLSKRINFAKQAPSDITYVTYEVYDLIRTLLIDEIVSNPGLWDDAREVALVGGIMVNRQSGDVFQPLLFEIRNVKGQTEYVFNEAFGPKPDLTAALGGAAGNNDFANKLIDNRAEKIWGRQNPDEGIVG